MSRKQHNHYRNFLSRFVGLITGGNTFSSLVHNNLSFVTFITVILLLYIRNSHFAEYQAAEVKQLQQEIKELKAQYLTINAEVSQIRKQSRILERVDSIGLQPLTRPPYKLTIIKGSANE